MDAEVHHGPVQFTDPAYRSIGMDAGGTYHVGPYHRVTLCADTIFATRPEPDFEKLRFLGIAQVLLANPMSADIRTPAQRTYDDDLAVALDEARAGVMSGGGTI